jgi:peptide deformylase
MDKQVEETKVIKIIADQKALRILSTPTSREEVDKLGLKVTLETTLAHYRGYGVAAIQIGVPLRYAYLRIGERELELINPILLEKSGWMVCAQEGCLSLPGNRVNVQRWQKVKIDIHGDGKEIHEFEGVEAQILQHEIDHMDGILNIDKEYKHEKLPGRNEPCPCGSGKKYKKCCGK